ncbi:hypothetical protein [uncultured Photobacterium sp.]|uniref:hypothetical protein n=1 Tax=uncultured Photobacterium sp. TaxID=173973 RepID=UPI002601B807|nr:hypothetical protein [uncultured Photobacterium sp.]
MPIEENVISTQQQLESWRLRITDDATQCVEKIQHCIEQHYRAPHKQQSGECYESRETTKNSIGHVLIGFSYRSSKNDLWDKAMTYRLRICDYSREHTGRYKRYAGLTPDQLSKARQRNYLIPAEEDGSYSRTTLYKYMTDAEMALYDRLDIHLAPLLTMYRYLQDCYRENLKQERLMLRRFCKQQGIFVPRLETAGLLMLREAVEDEQQRQPIKEDHYG